VRVQDKLNQVAYGIVPLSTLDLSTSKLLEQNFPNPFISNTEIRFIVPEETAVSFILYDITGRRVRTLVDDELDKGRYTINWDSKDDKNTDLPPGLYIGSLVIQDREEKLKMLKTGRN